jgi:hypothetical protein
MNKQTESCSVSIPEYNIPGNLFLVNDWQEINPTPNCGVITLWVLEKTCNEN